MNHIQLRERAVEAWADVAGYLADHIDPGTLELPGGGHRRKAEQLFEAAVEADDRWRQAMALAGETPPAQYSRMTDQIRATVQSLQVLDDRLVPSALGHLKQPGLGEPRSPFIDPRTGAPAPFIHPSGSDGRSAPAGMRASYERPLNWGAEFIEARRAIGAQLLDPGTAPVSVPLAREPITDPRQAAFVFQLMPTEDAPGGHFAYLKQTVRELNAAIVPRGGLKPVSRFKLERREDSTKVVAHISDPLDRFDLADAAALERFLDAEMQYGLSKAFDAHVLAQLLAEATAGGAVSLAAIRAAITALQERDMAPSGIVLAPSDWESVEGEAVALNSVNSPSPNDAMAQRLYSVSVVVSNSIATGTALVGDFRGSAEIYRTGTAQLSLHDSHPREVDGEDAPVADFRLNQVVARSEMRAEIAVTRPAGFIRLGGA